MTSGRAWDRYAIVDCRAVGTIGQGAPKFVVWHTPAFLVVPAICFAGKLCLIVREPRH